MSLQIKQGFKLRTWKRLVDCMAPKNDGIPAVDRLRIIIVFEANANIFLKILWSKRFMYHAKKKIDSSKPIWFACRAQRHMRSCQEKTST